MTSRIRVAVKDSAYKVHAAGATLIALLKRMGYPQVRVLESSLAVASSGAGQSPADDPLLALPVLHFALLDYSEKLTAKLIAGGYSFYSKSDLAFVRSAFRACRDELKFFPRLTVEQFLRWGFAEQRLLLLSAVLRKCIAAGGKSSFRDTKAKTKKKIAPRTGTPCVTYPTKKAAPREAASSSASDAAAFVRRARAERQRGGAPRSSGTPPPEPPVKRAPQRQSRRTRADAAAAALAAAPPSSTHALAALEALRTSLNERCDGIEAALARATEATSTRLERLERRLLALETQRAAAGALRHDVVVDDEGEGDAEEEEEEEDDDEQDAREFDEALARARAT